MYLWKSFLTTCWPFFIVKSLRTISKQEANWCAPFRANAWVEHSRQVGRGGPTTGGLSGWLSTTAPQHKSVWLRTTVYACVGLYWACFPSFLWGSQHISLDVISLRKEHPMEKVLKVLWFSKHPVRPCTSFLRLLSQSTTNQMVLKQYKIVSVLEDRSLNSRCWQGHPPSEISKGESFLASYSFWYLLAILGVPRLGDASLYPLPPWLHGFLLSMCLCLTGCLLFLEGHQAHQIRAHPNDIFTWLHLLRPNFQIKSQSRVPVVRTWTYFSGGTLQPTTDPFGWRTLKQFIHMNRMQTMRRLVAEAKGRDW